MKKVLLVSGGWEKHEPHQKAEIVTQWLEASGYSVTLRHDLKAFEAEDLSAYALIIPIWSAVSSESITDKQALNVVHAVEAGTGIAGFHNGLLSFPANYDWRFMAGAHWAAHIGGENVRYTVEVKKSSAHPIINSVEDFNVCTEQFYFHVDPAATILATTRLPYGDAPYMANGALDLPVAYIKQWGHGRVYYCALGHSADDIAQKTTATLIQRGLLWAAGEAHV